MATRSACLAVLLSISILGSLATGSSKGFASPATESLKFSPNLASLPQTSHGPILIDGDSAFTSANGVTGGVGTRADPYRIEGWSIDAASGTGITVRNTTSYFIVRDVSVTSSNAGSEGIHLIAASHAVVERSSVTVQSIGIDLDYSANPEIRLNTVSGGTVAIRLNLSSQGNVTGNSVTGNQWGILLNEYDTANITGNQISGNTGYGIRFAFSLRVRTFLNNFVNNGINAYSAPGTPYDNAWDDGYPSGGNYWADYVGVDNCSGPAQDVCPDSDGIGDTAYAISNAPNQDGYPLMTPYVPSGIKRPPILIQSNAEFTSGKGVTHGIGTSSDPYVIEGWDIDATTADGIQVRNTTAYFSIQNVSVHSGGPPRAGIHVVNATHARVTNVSSSRNWFGIYFEFVSDSLVDGNNVGESGFVGIAFDWPTNVTASGNVVSDTDYVGIGSNHARDLAYRSNRVIHTNNTGLGFNLADHVVADANQVSGSLQAGLSFISSSNGTLHANALQDNYVQIAIDTSDNATIRSNELERGTYGLDVSRSRDLTVSENNFTASADWMVHLSQSSGVAVYHNVLVDFGNVAYDDAAGANRWDDGYPSGGNFWGDIRQDADSCSGPAQDVCPDPDGIADTPREVLGNPSNMDRYPLMRPFPANPVSVSFVLFGAAASGWGPTPSTLTNPGPTLTVPLGAAVSLTLNGTDGQSHSWFLDYNDNLIADAGEPRSPTFTTQAVVFVFTPGVTGTYTYRCLFHAVSMTGSMVITTGSPPPSASFTVAPSLVNTTSPVTVDASASRTARGSTSGLLYRWDWEDDGSEDTMWSRNASAMHVYPADRDYTIRLLVMDPDGVVATVTHFVVADGVPPVTEVQLLGSAGTNGWYLSPVSVTLTADDLRAGIDFTQYRIDGGAWLPYTGSFTISAEGTHTVDVQSADLVRNLEPPHATTIRIDETAPVITNLTHPGTVGTANVTLSWNGQDTGSGIARFEISVDNGSFTSVGLNLTTALSLSAGTHYIRVRAIDEAGNSAIASVTILVSLPAPGPAFDPVLVGALVGVAILVAAVAVFLVRRRRHYGRPPMGGAERPENP